MLPEQGKMHQIGSKQIGVRLLFNELGTQEVVVSVAPAIF
jgi:hypothetical protein